MESFLEELKVTIKNGDVKYGILKAYYICQYCKEITHNYTHVFKCKHCKKKYNITNDVVDKMEKGVR